MLGFFITVITQRASAFIMRAGVIMLLCLQGALSLHIGVTQPRRLSQPRRAQVIAREPVKPVCALHLCTSQPKDPTQTSTSVHRSFAHAQVVDTDECIVEAENPAEAEECLAPATERPPRADKWDIDGYLPKGDGKGMPSGSCRRGTHGLEECLAEAENADQTADCYEDYGVAPPQ